MWWKRQIVIENLLEIMVLGQEKEIFRRKLRCLWAHASVNWKNLHPHSMVITLHSLHCYAGSQSYSWYDFNLLCFAAVILGVYLYLQWFPLGVAYVFALHICSTPCVAAAAPLKILQPDAKGKRNADFLFTLKHSLLTPCLVSQDQRWFFTRVKSRHNSPVVPGTSTLYVSQSPLLLT